MRGVSRMLRILRWGILTALVATGLTAFLILCSETTPGEPMPLKLFLYSKLGAGAIIYLSVQAAKFFNQRGLLPDLHDTEEEKEE